MQEGCAGIWIGQPDTTIPASSLHNRHKTVFSPPELSSTLSGQVQKHVCVGAGLFGKGQRLPCSTRISTAYLVRKERKTARIRTELESGTSSTSGNSNIAFPKTAKASSATYVSGPCLYCIPTTLASCCKRQPHFLGTWFPPSSASLGLPWKSTFSTFSFFTGQLELTIGSPFEVPVFPQQHIAIPDHWLQSGSGCITLTSTSSVQFTFPRAELKNAKVKAYIALKN